MVSSVLQVVHSLAEGGFTLRRATPRGRDHLTLEAWSGTTLHGGQWHRDEASAERASAKVRAGFGPDSVVQLPDAGVVLHRGGADPDLPGLRAVARAPGTVLLSHRVGRRGVVRTADGDFTKVVRPKALQSLVHSLTGVQAAGLAVPRIRDVDPGLGAVTTAALPGATLHARLADTSVPDHQVAAEVHDLGAALRELHEMPLPDRPWHDAVAELAVTRRWLEAAAEHELIPERRWRPAWERAAAALAGPPAPPAHVHRDLHDKQVLTAPGGTVGLLDLDLMCPGEAAVDLGNLLAHLQLRVLQGHCSTGRAACCDEALLQGYAPGRRVRARLQAYALTTRLRLAAVYAFRAASPLLIDRLLTTDRDRELVP